MKLGRLVGVVAALVLIVGSEAWAGCAWVLWEELSVAGPGEPSWKVIGPAETPEDCASISRAVVKDRASRKIEGLQMKAQGNVVQETFDSPGYATFFRRYLCLPDTVDPRPRTKE